MAGSLKTEGIVLRSLRYGEADRILHLYTPDRGRVSAIAKGVRRARSRFGGRLEPFFRLKLVLYQGRADLLTVTSAETVAAHPRLREDAPRARRRRPRLRGGGARVRRRRPAPGVYHLLANELALLDREPGARQPRQPARLPPQAAARRRLRAAARRLRVVRRARAPDRLLRRRRRRRVRGLRGERVPARPGGARLPRGRARAAAGGGAGGLAARAAPGRARDPARRWSTTRTCGSDPWAAGRIAAMARSGSTTSPRARATCATCSAARAPTSPR